MISSPKRRIYSTMDIYAPTKKKQPGKAAFTISFDDAMTICQFRSRLPLQPKSLVGHYSKYRPSF